MILAKFLWPRNIVFFNLIQSREEDRVYSVFFLLVCSRRVVLSGVHHYYSGTFIKSICINSDHTYTPRKGALSTLPDYSYASLTITCVIAASVSHITKTLIRLVHALLTGLRLLHCKQNSELRCFNPLFIYSR